MKEFKKKKKNKKITRNESVVLRFYTKSVFYLCLYLRHLFFDHRNIVR